MGWMAEALALALGGVYLMLLLAFLAGICRLRPGTCKAQPTVTVVVAAHSESENIDACLSALAAQRYPSDRTEIVVVDDRSTDDTPSRAGQWAGRIPGLRVVRVADARYACPKKNALDLGIRTGSGELILTTDADCRPPPSWIASTARCFDAATGMVIGYAPLIPSNTGRLQGLLSLQGLVVSALAAGSAGIGFPLTCSGRNLAYRRSAFEAVGGFSAIGHILGGDDVLLMRRIAACTEWNVRFNPDAGSGVPSTPHDYGMFRRQVRYQSKAVHYGIPVLILALPMYIFHSILAAGPLLLYACAELRWPLAGLLAAKTIADAAFLKTAAVRFGAPLRTAWFILLELISVPYVVLFCALGAFKPGRLRWK